MISKTMLILLLSPVVLGASMSPGATLPPEERLALLSQANEVFQQANAADSPAQAKALYGRAVLLYEKIVNDGQVHNARLYYNLGNAYFLNDDIGRAILNYRRAERLDASDVGIHNNLAFARSQRLDQVAVQAEKRVLETLFFWHYDFALQTKFFLMCLFFALCCGVLTAMVWLGSGVATLAAAILSAAIVVCFLTSVVLDVHGQATVAHGVITAPEIIARQGDGPNYPPSFKDPLHAGTEFKLLEQRPGWFHLELSDGSDAWIPDDAAGLV